MIIYDTGSEISISNIAPQGHEIQNGKTITITGTDVEKSVSVTDEGVAYDKDLRKVVAAKDCSRIGMSFVWPKGKHPLIGRLNEQDSMKIDEIMDIAGQGGKQNCVV